MTPPRGTEFRLETYERLTKIAKARLKVIKKSVDDLTEQTTDLTDIQEKTLLAYLTESKTKKDDYEGNLLRILNSSSDQAIDMDSLISDQNEINELFIHTSSRIESLVSVNNSKTDTGTQDSSAISNTTILNDGQVRLPKINLPKFNGDLATWSSFINLYDTTIHKNSALSNVVRFQYLLGLLEKEPLNLVRSLSITDENYVIAYTLLRDRYHNERRLQLLHIHQLLDLPNISASNINGVRHFVNLFNENTQALQALNYDVQSNNLLLSVVLLKKMDLKLCQSLESVRNTTDISDHSLPTSQQIIEFLNKKCNHLEDAMLSQKMRSVDDEPIHTRSKFTRQPVLVKKNVAMTVTQSSQNSNKPVQFFPCFVCNQSGHKIYTCPTFLAQSPNERYQLVKQSQRCVSCLGLHATKACISRSSCKKCGNQRHHTLLHFDHIKTDQVVFPSTKVTTQTNSPSTKPAMLMPNTSVSLVSHNQSKSKSTVLLGTLLVQITSSCGEPHVFRALIDSGSMCNLITERAAMILNLKRTKSTVQLSGIDQHVTQNRGQILIDLKSLSGKTIVEAQPALILDKLTINLPRSPISLEVLQLTRSYELADPTFHIPSRIDLVIGSAIFPQLLTQNQFSLGPNLPTALGTHFGYVLMGTAPCVSPINDATVNPISTLNVCLHAINDADLHSAIQKFWIQEEIPSKSTLSNEETLCDNHFTSTHSRDESGRYVVRLPFKESHSCLGESKHAAETRLHTMERKFGVNGNFSQLYHDFIDEYLSLGHMTYLSNADLTQPHYFLPHHGVIKESSSTTKLRTVFDASCKTSSGLSLNDILLKGPKLQNNICDLLLQFRRHNIVFCCDIRQMYRQITVHPDDRQFQLILWRQDSKQPVDIFQLNTVTYGMNSSPYLAIRTLHQLATDEGYKYPVAAHALQHHTYVDDIITGADTTEEALLLQSQLIKLLKEGCFELRKWVSNSPHVLTTIPQSHLETPKFLQNSDALHFNVLGLQWSPTSDTFSYNFQTAQSDKVSTKRLVLSTIAQIFDPCGFLVPFIMMAKCFMQLLWTKGLSWDSPLPADLHTQWKTFSVETKFLPQISIPRSLNLSSTCKIELHGFCDASELGYAAVTYIRSEFQDKSVCTNLMMAKSRVSPLKRVTIPRLELCAAYLLAQLIAHIQSLFSMFNSQNTHLWSDSTIVLTWIQTPPYRLKTFVANRISQIQDLTPTESWKHIQSEHNPADCASRGIRLSSLINHESWWHGPNWLSLPTSQWPSSNFNHIPLDSSHEIKTNPLPVFVTVHRPEWSVLTKFSSWMTLVRVMSFVLRFIHNCRNPNRHSDCLTTQELNNARNTIFKLVQQSTMHDEFKLLSQEKPCSKRLLRLKPFIDSDNLIRVGGRINQAPLSYATRHPIVLPKHHHAINIMIDYYHICYLHAGPQLIQSLLSKQVWILCARNVIRSRIFKCITCFKLRPKSSTPLMGDLPACRITPAKPFLSTGIDYGGPFNIKITDLRFIKHIKVYICIFICMVTKAVHIEVVHDLSTSAFIAALIRFLSRRGHCSDIYSDCGSNFVGANLELQRIIKNLKIQETRASITKFASGQGINFHFNPPASPHHGGLWESAIKSAKHHLSRVIGSSTLTYPEFTTLTTRVEAMINSRPLTPISADPSDLSALTPGHFLTGAPLVSIPENDLSDVPTNRLKHWQQTQAFFQNIWKRWTMEYFHTLQQRSKWITPTKNLNIGDLVLIQSSTPTLHWPLARITHLFPGNDGVVRVVEVRTANSCFRRPVTKLCKLPID